MSRDNPVIDVVGEYGMNLTVSFDDVTSVTSQGQNQVEIAIEGRGVHSVTMPEDTQQKLQAYLAQRAFV